MADARSPHFNLPIPDEGNLTSEEFVRLRNMVLGIEGVVKSLSDTLDGKAEAGHDHQISGVQGLQSELTNLSDAIAALQSPTLASLNDVDVSSATNGHVLLYLGASWQAAKIAAANVTYGGAGSVEGALDNIAVSLDGKAATLHQHTIAQVTGLQAALDGKASTADLAGKLGATATAQNSNQLGGLSANQFLRANAGATKTAGHLTFNDSIYARFGTGADLHVGHNGANAYLYNSTGQFYIQSRSHSNTNGVYIQDEDSAGANHTVAIFEHDRALLQYDGFPRVQTTSAGGTLTGNWTATGSITASNNLFVGANGGGDSWIYCYDDNSNTWREIGWDDSLNAFVAEENDGGHHKIALVSIDSAPGTTNFPIGTLLIVSAATNPDRCASRAIYLFSLNNDQYVDGTHANRGAQLTGTWRHRGVCGGGGVGYERVA